MSENKDYRRSLVMTPKSTTQFNQFLPSKDKQSGYVPVPLRKKRTDSQSDDNRRSWASPMFTEEDGSFSRSQSLGDIPVEEPVQKVQYEDLQKMREKIKHNEDKWQDDLTKWKNRRKSVNSDIMKKKEEREQIEILTSGSGTRRSKTFKEMEEERESREPGFKSRFSTFSTSEDLEVFDEPTPKTRVLPRRSYTVDNPYSMSRSKVHSLPSLADDEPEVGSLPPDEVETPSNPIQSSLGTTLPTSQEKETSISVSHDIMDYPVKNSVISKPNLLEPTITNISSPPIEDNSSSKPVPKSNNFNPVPAPRQNLSQTSMHKPVSAETKQPIAPRVSASLPRSYQRSDSARITSVITPRPFGTTSTKVNSLPRAYTVDDSQKRFNGETNSSNNVSAPKRYAAFLKEDSKTSSMQSSNENEGEEEEQVFPPIRTSSSVTPVSRVAPQPKTVSSVNSTQQENYSDMRISLNQKPKSNHDFGFQSNWDSTGVVVKSIQQGSPAEMCHLQVGDKILAVNGQKVADMSYDKWKRSMDEALQEGSLFMDIRRQGKNSFPEPYTNTSLNFSSLPAMDSTVKTVNVSSHSINSLSSNVINGGIREEPVNLRSNESLSLKNLKRRSEFFEQGGAENQMPNQLASSLSTSSTRWSWDPEEERRRQEKWQKEQDRQLQEKYRRDQEKMDEEFRKAQQVAVTAGSKNLEEMRNLKLEQEASRLALKEKEERKRREEQKHLEEERKRKEEQERLEVKRKEEQKRLEEEREKKEEQKRLEEEVKRREEEKKREEQKRLEEERKKEEVELKRREEEKKRREEEAQRLQKSREEGEKRRQEAQRRLQANDGEYTFPELSYLHRTKSKSTPELDDIDRTDIKAISSGMGQSSLNKAGQDKTEPATQAEVERQQIIQDMKKKNALLTDSSWIRQNAMNSVNKEPTSLPMRRGESLDNLDMTTNRTSWRSSWTPGTNSSTPDYSRPYSSNSGSSSIQSGYSGAATLPSFQSLNSQRPLFSQSTATTPTSPENQSSSRNRSVSGKKMCTNCAMPLGKGAAMIIESLGLCYHLHCFKCIKCKTDLGGSEIGAEVRIRNKQLFCNSCYMRIKTGQPTAM